MPTYAYSCSKCGHEFDQVQSITAPALSVCPKDQCQMARWGKGRVKRGVGGGAGLLFKGTGFYITDYRSESYKKSATQESSSAKPAPSSSGDSSGKSGGGDGAKSSGDSKPAATQSSAKAPKTA